jgi:ribosomal protein L21E
MASRYKKGQKVTIVPSKDQPASPRDADIEPYIGQSGKIVDYYWIRPCTEVFYIYTVRIGNSKKEVVVHEDEIEAHIE